MYIQACLSGRTQALQGRRGPPRHSQSLTVPVEVAYFPGAAVGRPKSDKVQWLSSLFRLVMAYIYGDIVYIYIYIYIYGNGPLIRDKDNMTKCILRVFGSSTMNYSMNYFTLLFVDLHWPQAPFSDWILLIITIHWLTVLISSYSGLFLLCISIYI